MSNQTIIIHIGNNRINKATSRPASVVKIIVTGTLPRDPKDSVRGKSTSLVKEYLK